jgi:GDPmannose 4,6-dehydratase
MTEKHKRALVLGCFGMDGSHMVDLLLSQRYYVVGLAKSFVPFQSHISPDFKFFKGDIRDSNLIEQIILEHNIEEIYNFAGITFSPFADLNPDLTLEVNRNAPIRIAKICQKHDRKFIQASSSEIFGNVSDCKLDEKSERNPHSGYSLAKYDVDQLMSELRKSGHKMYNAILFPHESERRKPEFLIRKICKGVADIHLGMRDHIQLGSIDSTRDWSSSKDFVYWMYLMTKSKPDEYVLASGELHSVADVLDIAFEYVGILDWSRLVQVDQQLIRKVDRNNLIGDSSKIKLITGKSLDMGFQSMIENITRYDLENNR